MPHATLAREDGRLEVELERAGAAGAAAAAYLGRQCDAEPSEEDQRLHHSTSRANARRQTKTLKAKSQN